jgi:hypothetical protein
VFLIKWMGYGMDACTWEPESNLRCPAALSAFNSRCRLVGMHQV